MGVLDKLFGSKKNVELTSAPAFETVTEYKPTFSNWRGDMYQQQLVRAVIERIAVACSKLDPRVVGSAKPRIARAIETSPNQFMSWPKFLARCATIYYNENNLFIVPAFKPGTDTVVGIYPLKPNYAEVVEHAGEPWYIFYMANGKRMAIECKLVCLLTRFQYKSDWFGSENILGSTLGLLRAQEDAQETAMKNSANIRFVAAVNGQVREDELKAKVDRFSEDYLNAENNRSGIAAYDATIKELKQVEPYNWTIPSDEMARIRDDVFFYFGMNESILTNQYDENEWSAFYEGVIEPFAVQLGEGLSQMLYTMRERPNNAIEFSASRLQYSSNATKRNMNKDMLDRGVYTINDALEVLQMPPRPDGDVYILRGEYKVAHDINEIIELQRAQAEEASGKEPASEWADIDRDAQDADLSRFDSEGYGSSDDFDSGTGGRRAD